MRYRSYQTIHSHIELLTLWLTTSIISLECLDLHYLRYVYPMSHYATDLLHDPNFSHQWKKIIEAFDTLDSTEYEPSLARLYSQLGNALTYTQINKIKSNIKEGQYA